MPVIDIHAHIYPDAIASRAVEAIGEFYDIPMQMDGTVQTLLRESKEAGITLSVVHSAAVVPGKVKSINDYLAKAANEHPDCLYVFGTLHPAMEDCGAELERMRALGLHGVKLHPDFQRFHLDDEGSLRMFRQIADVGFPVIIHTGDYRYSYSEPRRMARVLDEVPSLRAVCAHMGGWSVWKEARKLLAGRENCWVDTSSSLYALLPEEAEEIIRSYGAEHVLFGTDYPMWKPVDEMERFLAIPLTEREKDLILYQNAVKLLFP